MLVIADIFEALTAGDRPYKPGKTLREALKIMAAMRDDNHIDATAFELFVRSRVWQDYAEQHLPIERCATASILPPCYRTARRPSCRSRSGDDNGMEEIWPRPGEDPSPSPAAFIGHCRQPARCGLFE